MRASSSSVNLGRPSFRPAAAPAPRGQRHARAGAAEPGPARAATGARAAGGGPRPDRGAWRPAAARSAYRRAGAARPREDGSRAGARARQDHARATQGTYAQLEDAQRRGPARGAARAAVCAAPALTCTGCARACPSARPGRRQQTVSTVTACEFKLRSSPPSVGRQTRMPCNKRGGFVRRRVVPPVSRAAMQALGRCLPTIQDLGQARERRARRAFFLRLGGGLRGSRSRCGGHTPRGGWRPHWSHSASMVSKLNWYPVGSRLPHLGQASCAGTAGVRRVHPPAHGPAGRAAPLATARQQRCQRLARSGSYSQTAQTSPRVPTLTLELRSCVWACTVSSGPLTFGAR
jgi:hypothetical protein